MRINGQEITSLNEDVLVLPRANGDIVFKATAVADFEEFDQLCPVPLPPSLTTRTGTIDDTKDPSYKQQIQNHSLKRMAWMLVTSLAPSNIEWDTVDLEKPNTWENWTEDLSKVLAPAEQQRVLNFVLAVNCLDERKVEAARDAFLRGPAQGQ